MNIYDQTSRARTLVTFLPAVIIAAPLVALAMTGCDRTVSSSKTTTEKKVETPEGTKKVTESTEKKVTKEEK